MPEIPEGMEQATFDYVVAFTLAHEGETPFMYNNWPLKNVNKDVTAGVGLAITSEDMAASDEVRSLFVVKATGEPATPDDMRAEFRRVFNLKRTQDNLFSDYRDKSPLMIPHDAMMQMLVAKLLQFWSQKNQDLPPLDQIPAQAQVALMSYNYGLRLKGAPKMCGHVRDGDYAGAAAESRISAWDANKNKAHEVLFTNAQAIIDQGLDLTLLPPIEGPFKPPPSV